MTTCPLGRIRRSTPYWVPGDALLGQHSVNPCLPRAICALPPTEEPAGQRVVRRCPLPPIRDGGHPAVRLASEGPSARAGREYGDDDDRTKIHQFIGGGKYGRCHLVSGLTHESADGQPVLITICRPLPGFSGTSRTSGAADRPAPTGRSHRRRTPGAPRATP